MHFFRHAGLEEPAPYLIRGHLDVVPTNPGSGPGQASGTISKTGSRFSPGTLDSGWSLPRCRTGPERRLFWKLLVYKQTLNRAAPGYSMKAKKVIGGTKGCAHLTSLVIAMGESAVQGYWTAYGMERGRVGLPEQTLKKFINTRHLWKEDGPIIKGLRETLESQDSSE